MPKFIKFSLPLALTLIVGVGVQSIANATGGVGTGGGDRCENRFKVIAQDLETWIRDGGARGLKLGSASLAEYNVKMLNQIGKARITCVQQGDAEFPVTVYGKPKECKNYLDNEGMSRIVCDYNKFYGNVLNPENDSIQYQIVHHELASLAGLEAPEAENSHYELSNQITEFLQDQIVKRLAVKKPQVVTTPPETKAKVIGRFPGRDVDRRETTRANPCAITVTDYEEIFDNQAFVTDPEHQSKTSRKFVTQLTLAKKALTEDDRAILKLFEIPFHDEGNNTIVNTGMIESTIDNSSDLKVRPPKTGYAYVEPNWDEYMIVKYNEKKATYNRGRRYTTGALMRLSYDKKKKQVTGLELMLGSVSYGRNQEDYPCESLGRLECFVKSKAWAMQGESRNVGCYR